jgi:2-C-methyl-D-erythritol 4-phosphate cytidylyltransferase/2-C-methyl-D-erythritol 2,4-cyclodiphosphate synthase
VIVVLSPEELRGPRAEGARRLLKVEDVVAGGETRAESVSLGIQAAGDVRYVIVHDAARPLVPAALLDSVIETTRRRGAAVPVLEVPDTVKSVDGDRIRGTVPREGLRLAQTPQGARRDWLERALALARDEGTIVTDEAAALEHAGHEVVAVAGDAVNSKITTVEDLAAARRRLLPAADGLRVGSGFDIHRIDPERPLLLGGVLFDGEPGLAGHSDADVVLHAAMDAVLGAAGLGDIGVQFPPEDSRWSGADSTDLARRVAGFVEQRGWRIINLDLTLLAETPKIRNHLERMRASIGACLGVDAERIGLKATTLEQLGSLGRGEGIACQAVALLQSARQRD